jgi:acyl-CoA thioester hydrolase
METKTTLTVRYAETDQMGIVHHSNYAIWFEMGRTDFIKQFSVSYSNIEERGVLIPLY